MHFKESQTRGLTVRVPVSSDNAEELPAPRSVTQEALMWNHLAGSLTSMSGTFLEHQTRRSQTAIALAQREGMGEEKKKSPQADSITGLLSLWRLRAEVCENNIVFLATLRRSSARKCSTIRPHFALWCNFLNLFNCPSKFKEIFKN